MRIPRAAIAVLLAASFALAACHSRLRSDAQSATVVLPLRTFALNVDPATLADVDSRKVATLIHAGLIAVDLNGRIEPRAARSWRRIDPATWEFELGPGLKFTNGRPADAEAVVRSLCASMQPASTQAWSLASVVHETSADGKSVRCTGLSTNQGRVRIRESAPTPWLFEGLAGPGGWIVDPDAPKAAYGVRPGLGPYVISRVTQDQEIELRARSGGVSRAGVARVVFRYLPDTAIAATAFNNGALDLLDIDSPGLRALLFAADGQLRRKTAQVLRSDTDRVRVVAFNIKRLRDRGLTPEQAHALLVTYSQAVPRSEIARLSGGLATPLLTAFPAGPRSMPIVAPAHVEPPDRQKLRLISENDVWTDRIAAALPTRIGAATVSYTTLEKSLFLQALFKGDYDLALLKLEATHHTPRFWAAFFTPGNPYTVFGQPLPGLERLDLASPAGLAEAASRIDRDGNWVGVVRDVGLVAQSSRLVGVRLTGTGQLSLEGIALR